MTSVAHEIHSPHLPPFSHPPSASVALCFAIPQITRYILYYCPLHCQDFKGIKMRNRGGGHDVNKSPCASLKQFQPLSSIKKTHSPCFFFLLFSKSCEQLHDLFCFLLSLPRQDNISTEEARDSFIPRPHPTLRF